MSTQKKSSPAPEIEYLDKRTLHVNVKLVLGLVGTVCVVALGAHLVHKFQLNRNAYVLKQKAERAYEDDRIADALRYMSQYLSFPGRDEAETVEALSMYAQWSDERATTQNERKQAFLRLDDALRKNPENRDLRLRAARLAVRLQQFGDAIVHLKKLCESDPETCGSVELALLMARAHAGKGEPDAAAHWYVTALQIGEEHPEPANYVDLVLLIERNGEKMDLAALVKSFDLAGDADPEDSDRSRQIQRVCGDVLATMLKNCRGKSRANAYLARAAYFQGHGELEKAAADVEEALNLGEHVGDALFRGSQIELALSGQLRLSDEKADQQSADEHRQRALEYARRGRAAAPNDLRFYLVLAQLEVSSGDLDAGERILREGLEVVGKIRASGGSEKLDKTSLRQRDDLEIQLAWSLADLLVRRSFEAQSEEQRKNIIAEVNQKISRIKDLGGRPQLAEFLEARLALGRQDWPAAASKLEAVRSSLADIPDALHIADRALGECYQRMWRPDQRELVFRRAVQEDPFWDDGRLLWAESLLDIDKLDEAIRQYENLRLRKSRVVGGILVRLLIRKQLTLPSDQRNWKPIREVIDLIREGAPQAVEPDLFEAELDFQVAYDLYQNGSDKADFEAGEKVLTAARDAHPDDPRVCAALAGYVLRRSDQDMEVRLQRAAALLDGAIERLGNRIELRLARVQLALQMGAKAGAPLLERAAGETESLSAEDRSTLYQSLAQACFQFEKYADSLSYWRRAAAEAPEAIEVYLGAAEAAAASGDHVAFASALKNIERIEGRVEGKKDGKDAGPNSNFVKASAVLIELSTRENQEFSDKDRERLEKARVWLSETIRQRPTWMLAYRDLGIIEELRGNREAAFRHFRQALNLGDKTRSTVGRVVSYLHETQQDETAYQELMRVANSAPELLTGDFAQFASEIAQQQKRLLDVERIARKLGQRANDAQDLLVAAELKMFKEATRQEAEGLLRSAVERFPAARSAWYALVRYLVLAKRAAEAAEVVEQASKRVPVEPVYLRPSTLAGCYNLIGEKDKAKEQFRAAVEAAPQLPALAIDLVKFLVQENHPAEAEMELDRLLELKPAIDKQLAEDAKAAKALLHAGAGTSYEQRIKALKMLDGGRELSGQSSPNLLAQATILAQCHLRTDQLRLILVLNELKQRHELRPEGLLQLARLYEATGQFAEAVTAYRELKTTHPENAVFLVEFALGSMNQKSISPETLAEVAEAIDTLQRIEPYSFRTAVTRAKYLATNGQRDEAVTLLNDYLNDLPHLSPEDEVRRLVNERKPTEALEALRAVFKRKDEPAGAMLEKVDQLLKSGGEAEALAILQRFLIGTDYVDGVQTEMIHTVATFLESIAAYEAAEQSFRSYAAKSKRPEASLVLAAYIARRGRIDEALDLCEEAADRCAPNAIGQVSVGIIRTGHANPEQVNRVRDRLDAARANATGAVAAQLALTLADLLDYQEQYDVAADLYRELLEKDPTNIVALNNLAWLSSFHPGKRDESLSLIERAIQLRGPIADLLDTRAVVRLNLDLPKQALHDLKAALKEADTPTICLHMALAHMRDGDKVQAAEWFRKAEQAGLDPKSLHALERPGYDELLKKLPQNRRRG